MQPVAPTYIESMNLDGLLNEARSLRTLEQVFRWGVTKDPAILPDDVVIQDEYTHDVLFHQAGTYFVFDAT